MNKVYLANGLFSESDFNYNAYIAKRLREEIPNIDLYVPQENGEINDKNQYADSLAIAKADYSKVKDSDVLIAVLEGSEIDSGVAAEIGGAHALGKKVIGLSTDSRTQGRENPDKVSALVEDPFENQFKYFNLYVIGLVKDSGGKMVTSVDALVESVKEALK